MRSQTPQNKKPCEGWGDVTGQEIIGRRTLWDINGFICSDSVSCHVSLELLFSFSSPQNPGRNNLGSWQSWNLHQEKKNFTRMKAHQILLWSVFGPGFFIPRFLCPVGFVVSTIPFSFCIVSWKIPADSQRKTLNGRERERKN